MRCSCDCCESQVGPSASHFCTQDWESCSCLSLILGWRCDTLMSGALLHLAPSLSVEWHLVQWWTPSDGQQPCGSVPRTWVAQSVVWAVLHYVTQILQLECILTRCGRGTDSKTSPLLSSCDVNYEALVLERDIQFASSKKAPSKLRCYL